MSQYLDKNGLDTLWAKLKTTYARKVSASAGTDKVTVSLKDGAATPNVLSTADIPAATTSAAGVMTKDDKAKLNGIAAGATANTGTITGVTGGTGLSGSGTSGSVTISHATPSGASAKTSGLYKISTDAMGHVTGATAVAKADITGLGIPAQDTTYSDYAGSAHGLVPAKGSALPGKALLANGSWGDPTMAVNARFLEADPSSSWVGELTNDNGTLSYIDEDDNAWTITPQGQFSGNAASATTAGSVAWGNVTGKPSSFTPSSHTHGNIQNGGTLQSSDITVASGDKLVVTDSSDSSKVARTSVSFDGSTTTKALTPKGTWETFLKSHQSLSNYYNKTEVDNLLTGSVAYQGTFADCFTITASDASSKAGKVVAKKALKVGNYMVVSADTTINFSNRTITLGTGDMVFCKAAVANGGTVNGSNVDATFDFVQNEIDSIPTSYIDALS